MFEEFATWDCGERRVVLQWRDRWMCRGMVVIRPAEGGIGRIGGLCVAPVYRRDGIGRLLMRRACEIAAESGAALAVVDVGVYDEAPGAVEFFKACGFEEWKKDDPLDAPVGWVTLLKVLVDLEIPRPVVGAVGEGGLV